MSAIIEVEHLTKQYRNGPRALDDVSLTVNEGEILALLGPNGAGKTTLISTICGLVVPSSGTVRVGGHDIRHDWRRAREIIGLVPQEIALEPFEKVQDTVNFTRGLFGAPPDAEWLEWVLKSLTLWDKRNTMTMALSGGMKRRVLIAKALSHRPKVLFLDEPTAGVDVQLRHEMWEVVRQLRAEGVTVILTTHYLEEAEEMADRVGIINKGQLLLMRPTPELMDEFSRKQLTIDLDNPLSALPAAMRGRGLTLAEDGRQLIFDYDKRAERTGIARLIADLAAQNIAVRDVATRQSSLEDIFLNLVGEAEEAA